MLQQQFSSSYFMNTTPDTQEHVARHVHATFEAWGLNRTKRRATSASCLQGSTVLPSATMHVLCVVSTAPCEGTWTSEHRALTHTYCRKAVVPDSPLATFSFVLNSKWPKPPGDLGIQLSSPSALPCLIWQEQQRVPAQGKAQWCLMRLWGDCHCRLLRTA